MIENYIEKRKFRELCRERDLSHSYLWKICKDDKKLPSTDTIEKLKDLIPPNDWFFCDCEGLCHCGLRSEKT